VSQYTKFSLRIMHNTPKQVRDIWQKINVGIYNGHLVVVLEKRLMNNKGLLSLSPVRLHSMQTHQIHLR
jgi:hypothetical protein